MAERPAAPAGAVRVHDHRGKPLGVALWSPASEISLRMVDRDEAASLDHAWWRARIAAASHAALRSRDEANAFRIVHGEGDGCPSFVCDRYDRWLVVQFMSAGLESFRDGIVDVLEELFHAGRDPGAQRRRAPCERKAAGRRRAAARRGPRMRSRFRSTGCDTSPRPGAARRRAPSSTSARTGASPVRCARGRALDCFSYHGSFALHLARRADSVTAVDVSADALRRAEENAARNGLTNIALVEADTFDYLRDLERGARPSTRSCSTRPPSRKTARRSTPRCAATRTSTFARCVCSPRGGMLFTASCSFHVGKALFLEMLAAAAADSGRRVALRAITGQPLDHPEVLTIPETGYLKGALVECLE